MSARLFPATIKVTPETHIWFSSNTQLVLSNTAALHLMSFDRTTLEMTMETEIDLGAEDIADAMSFDDNLFILSRTASGSRWARKWRRRFDLNDDKWTSENPLYAYTLRLYSLASASQSQVGPPLLMPEPAVQMRIRARGDKVIVMAIGPRCVTSILKAPVRGDDCWSTLHEELTWDPREIARERGYENPDDEPAFEDEDEDEDEDADKDEPRSDRYEYKDRTILDYAFLSDTLVLRLSENALDRGEALFYLDIFEVGSSIVSSPADRHGLVFGRDLPRILEVIVGEDWAYQGMTTAFISRENTSIYQSDIISLMIYSSDTPYRSFIRASKLLSFISNPTSTYGTSEANTFSTTGDTPFTRFAKSAGDLELAPVLSKHLVLLPTCDVDPSSEHPTLATLRFLDFSDPHRPPKQIDLPLESLLAGAADIPFDLNRTENAYSLRPRFEVQWSGGDMLVVTFVNVDTARPFETKTWFVKMDATMLQKLGLL